MKTRVRVPRCQNCGTATPGSYCPECGQDSWERRVSLGILLRDFWQEVFSFDSRFFRSFAPLLLKPGELTVQYLAGRRARSLPPLRLFLFVSLAFFFLLSMRVSDRLAVPADPAEASPDSATVAAVVTGLSALPDSVRGGIPAGRLQELGRALLASQGSDHDEAPIHIEVMGRDVTRNADKVVMGTLKLASKVVFILVPLFTGLLALLYRRSRRLLIDHLVFTLHYHAFLFLLFATVLLVQWEWFVLAALAMTPVYLLLALRRVYAQGWPKTLVKLLGLCFVYNFVLLGVLALTAGSAAWLVSQSARYGWALRWLTS